MVFFWFYMNRVASSKTALIMAIIIKLKRKKDYYFINTWFSSNVFLRNIQNKEKQLLSLKINRQVFRLENDKPKRFAGFYIWRITKRITYEVDQSSFEFWQGAFAIKYQPYRSWIRVNRNFRLNVITLWCFSKTSSC